MTIFVGLSFCFRVLAVAASVSVPGSVEGQAQEITNSARVGVEIRVGPVAQVEFPHGTGFVLDIPSREEGLASRGPFSPTRAPHVDTAEIPFTVTGNAWVTVSARPAELLSLRGDGPVGKARPDDPDGPNRDVELPYRIRIEFPLGSPVRPIAGLENLRGRSLTDSVAWTANVADGPTPGAIHVVPDVTWGEIASRRFEHPGLYRGEVQLTIVAEDK